MMNSILIGMTAGTQVQTDRGDKNMEFLKVGDMVLTHMGRFRRVLASQERIYRGGIIRLTVYGKPSVTVSSEQTFFSREGDTRLWKKASDLMVRDELCVEEADGEGNVTGEWVKIRKVERIGGACRYLYGIEVEEDGSYTANGYIVNGQKS